MWGGGSLMNIKQPILFIVAVWWVLFADIANARADRRVALVVGNSAYAHTPPLANPANDATDIAAALRRLGFEVIAEVNLTKAKMDDAFRRFARAIDGADTALFYYAGHGLQFGGVNYLMPIDAKLRHEADLPYEMAKVDDVLADMARVNGVRMMVLDACRDNPLDASLKRSASRTRNVPATRGLARIARTKGLLVAYATQPGQVAEDGEEGNSPFTASLLRHLETPNLEVGPMFRRVLADVNGKTKGKQTPELSVSLLGEFYFKGAASGTANPGNAATERAPSGLNERAAFETAKDVDNVAAWDAFLKRFPDGFYADMARASRLKVIEDKTVRTRELEQAKRTADVSRRLRNFIEFDYLGAEFSNPVVVRRLFSAEVDYRGKGKVPVDEVVADKVSYAKRWTHLGYELVDGSLLVRASDGTADQYAAEFKIRFEVRNAKKTITGTSASTLKISLASGVPVITAEAGHLLTRSVANLDSTSNAKRSYWDHNGSLMRLATDGDRRKFFYENPSSRMARAVATVDRLLFSGRQAGRRYEGTAYVYATRCRRKYGYQVKGDISEDGKRVVMRGAAPVIGSNCRVSRYDWNSNSTLVFSFQYAQ